jgi:hypothetical protein
MAYPERLAGLNVGFGGGGRADKTIQESGIA